MKMVRKRKVWTEDKCKRLAEIYSSYTNQELAAMFGSTRKSVAAVAGKLGLRKSREFMDRHTGPSRFAKGHTPSNKGRRQSEWMSAEMIERTRATRFRPGSVPHNTLPVGSERTTTDGYVVVKVCGQGRQRDKWRYKHILVWERANGKLPDGHIVAFRDGDRRNFDLSNLELRTRAEHVALTAHVMPLEIRQAIQLRSAISRQLNKILKDNDNDRGT